MSRVTNSPLTSPISAATTRLIKNARPSEVRPALNSVHMTTGAKPNSEPTERSNSPAVMSSVMASAMSPSSTVKVSVLLILRTDRKSGLIAVKTASSSTSRTNGPNSGAETIRRRVELVCTCGHRCNELGVTPSRVLLAGQLDSAWIPLISRDFEPKSGVRFSAILLRARRRSGWPPRSSPPGPAKRAGPGGRRGRPSATESLRQDNQLGYLPDMILS